MASNGSSADNNELNMLDDGNDLADVDAMVQEVITEVPLGKI